MIRSFLLRTAALNFVADAVMGRLHRMGVPALVEYARAEKA